MTFYFHIKAQESVTKTSLLVGGSLPASPGAVLAKKKKKIISFY